MSNLNGGARTRARLGTPTCYAQMAALLRSLRKTSRDKLPNLAIPRVRRRAREGVDENSRNPGISSNVAIPLSARSSSGFWISRASSSTFFAFDIFPAGIHETGAAWFIARAIAVAHSQKVSPGANANDSFCESRATPAHSVPSFRSTDRPTDGADLLVFVRWRFVYLVRLVFFSPQGWLNQSFGLSKPTELTHCGHKFTHALAHKVVRKL